MKIPFGLTLKGMLLSGKDRDRAEAKHNLSGEGLDRALLDINFDDKDTIEYKLKSLKIDKKYERISAIDYEKNKATILEEPWVGYRDYGLENTAGKTGFWFELDWNDNFVALLRKEGYEDISDERVVQKWYAELCRTVAVEEGLALDLFPDADEQPNNIKKTRRDDGTVEYS